MNAAKFYNHFIYYIVRIYIDFSQILCYNKYRKNERKLIVVNDSHLFKIARQCSLRADYNGCCRAKIGCIIVYKNAILAKGWNSDKTHTAQAHYNKWRYKNSSNDYLPEKLHAEIGCLEKIKYLDISFSRVHLYIYRELKNGQLAMARPCAACMAAIREMGIRHIHYTTECGFAHEILKGDTL